MEKKSKPKGAKTNRSETLSIRLDPKLRYLTELGARLHRRSLSSFIEWAIEDVLKKTYLDQGNNNGFHHEDRLNIIEEAGFLWDIDESDRLVKLALRHPSLLTHEEQIVWKLIRENGSLWKGKFVNNEWTWTVHEPSFIYERLREHWDQFLAVARGESGKETLPGWKKTQEQSEFPF